MSGILTCSTKQLMILILSGPHSLKLSTRDQVSTNQWARAQAKIIKKSVIILAS